MSYFKRARNHKKSYSKTLDEKIAKAYKEFEKTGVSEVILESPSNSTAGVYYAGKEIPEVPAVFTDVPDPNGVMSSGWTQPTNGFDANDSSTWANAYTDTSWLYNPNEVFGQTGRPVVDSVPTTWQNATQGAGIMTAWVGWGQSLGYLDENGKYQPLVTAGMMGSGMIPPIARGSHFDGAHYTYAIPDDRWAAIQSIWAKYQEMVESGNYVAQQIKVWYGTSYFFDGPWENIGGVKRETDHHKLINATIFKRAGKYESEPVIPAYTQVIFKDEIGRAQNLNMSGFQKALNGLFGLGNNALQSLTNRIIYGKGGPTGGFAADPKYTKEKIQQIANNISDPEKKADFEKKMADLTSTIEKTAQVQKEAETEAKNIAAKFGLDVALTIFGGAILKGAGAAASKIPGASSIVSKATATGGAVIDKVTNLLKLTGKVDDAAALATATKAVNTATKAEQAAKAANALEAIGGTLDDVDDIVAVVGSAKYQAAMTQAKLAGTTTSSSASNAAFNAIETAIQSGSDDAMKAAVKNANSTVLGAASGASTKFSNVVSTSNNLNRISKSINTADDLAANADDIGINVGKVYKQLKGVDKKLAQEYASLGKELKTLMSWNTTPGTISNVKSLLKAMDKVAKKVNLVQSYESQGQVLTEKNHLRARREEKRELVEKKFSGKVAKVNIPGPNDHLTVKAIDMLRQYKVSEKEMQEYAAIIGDINQWIRENPKEYEIWKVRYPANDPRLAELNWRTDQQLRASEEYIETRFPQNQKLYKKLKKKIEININATDPTRFKNERAEIVYKKLLSVSRAIKLDTLAPVKKLKEHKIKYKLAESNKSDWKEDFYVWPSYLCEGMTTGSLFNMALNPTGSEPVEIMVDFSPDVLQNQGAPGTEEMYQAPPYDPATEHTRIGMQSDGTGIGIEGFDGEYLAIAGSTWRDGNTTSQPTTYFYTTQPIDLSKSDSITMTIKAGNNSNGGMLPHAPLYASLLNPFLMNDESAGYGLANLTNPDCVAYHSSDPDYRPIIDPTIHDYDDGYSGEQYTGNGIVAHQTGDDITITLDIPEKYRMKGNQIFFSTANGDYVPGYGTDHHRHLDRQTLPVPGIDGQPLNDLWGHDFTWLVARYLSNTAFPESGWFVANESNGKSPARNLGWTLWHNAQSNKFPNYPIGQDANAGGTPITLTIDGVTSTWYIQAGDPAPITGYTYSSDHTYYGGTPAITDADYEEVGRLVLEHFKDAPLYGIKNIQTSRRLPMNVMVGLDDPAASAFIRIGSGPQEGKTSPKKRKKRVETILKASKEYTDKYVAPDLPGSNATFGDVQASPTGYGEVQDKFADVKDSDIPGNLNTATPDDVGSPFLDSAKVDSDMWSSEVQKQEAAAMEKAGIPADIQDSKNKFDGILANINSNKVLTSEEKKFLTDNGLDDFIKGGKTQSPLGDLGILAATYAAVKSIPAVLSAVKGGAPGVFAGKAPHAPQVMVNGKWVDISSKAANAGRQTAKQIWNTKTGKWDIIKNTDGLKWDWAQRWLKPTGPNSNAHYVKTGELPTGLKGWRPFQAVLNIQNALTTGLTPLAEKGLQILGAGLVGAGIKSNLNPTTGYDPNTTPNNDAGWKEYESEKESVSMYNEMINQQRDVLIQKSLDLWDKIRENNYQGQDWADRPYYAKNDEEMTAEYMEAGGEDIDAQMAALEAKYKDEPIPPNGSSDPGKLSGELGVGEVKDMVNASPQELENIANEIMSKGSFVDKLKGLLDSAKDTFFDTARAGNVFFDYLTNNLPDVIGVDYLGQEYVDNAFKNAQIYDDGRVKVGDNIIGTGQKPYYDPKTREIVIEFNYDFQKNADEFAGNEHRMTWMQKTFGLAVYDYIGEYSIDASIKLGSDPISALIGMMTGGILGKAVNFAKFFGGGEHKKGEIRMSAQQVKEMNKDFFYGALKMDEILMEAELSKYDKLSQKEAEDKAYALFSDKNIDQEQLGDVFNEVYEANEGFARARTETEAIRDGVKTAQKEYNEAASAWSNAFADNKYTGTKGWLNLPDEQRFEKADMSGDYQTYVSDKAFVEKWKADAKKGANVYEIGYNYAEKQPAFKQSRKAYDDHEKVLDKLSSDRAAAYEAVTSFLGGLGPHPSPELARKGYLDCDIECMQKKIKLENAAKAASAKEDEGQKKRESLWNSHISTRNSLRDEYVDRNMNQMNLSIKASDTIRSKIKDMKKVYEEKKKVSDELRKTEKERIKAVYDSDWFKKANEQLAKDLLKGWDRHTIENMELETAKDEKDPNKGNWDNFEWDELAGAGGSPGQPYTPPKEDPKNPWVPAPGRDTASGEGGSPGQPYVPPKEDPKNPWVPAPGRNNQIAGSLTGGPRTSPLSGAGKGPHPGPGWKWYPDAKGGQGDYLPVPKASAGGDGTQIAKRKKELGSTIADVSQGLSATDAASIAGSQTTSKGTKKKKKYNTKTVVASFKPQGGTLKETTFEKIRKLRKSWDYEGKPTPTETGFPEKEPPERVNGWHPEYGKGHEKRYKKLDPHSAKTMARVKTGDPKVDNIVKKQAKG